MRLLRDLQAQPDDQAYLCNDVKTAKKHNLSMPFRCGCRRWLGGGCVSIEFYAPDSDIYTEQSVVLIQSIEPIQGESFTFNDPAW